MKKIFLSILLLVTLFINHEIHADELILSSGENVEVKADAFLQDDKGMITLVKGSNLLVTFIHNKNLVDEVNEPKISVSVFDKDNKIVWTTSNPKTKAPSPESSSFAKYLETNKTFFESVYFIDNKIEIKIPLDFIGGKYNVKVSSTNYKNIALDYSFDLSNSAYTFTDSDLVIEDTNILASIGYVSMLDKEETNKVVVTLTQAGNELFKKEIDKTFYKEGNILIDEKIDALLDLKGQAELKVEVKDKDGVVILSKTKSIDINKSNNKYLYYMILGILIILLIIIFLIFKNKKTKTLMTVLLLMLTTITLVSFNTVDAANECGTKPANECVENKVKTWVCQLTNSCSTEDARVRKYFSTGKSLDIPSALGSTGPVSVSVNVCTNISQTLNSGDNFYVISDSNSSSWQKKRFHVFKFVKGTSETVTFDPGGDKRNVNYATYNGNCDVTVYGRYSGASSEFKAVKTTIIETGKVETNMCKSATVTSDVFESNGSLLSKSQCSTSELLNTFIAGSVYFPPVYNTTNSWQDKTVNVCDYLGYTTSNIPTGKKFYALTEQTSSWTMIDFPLFQFTFGTPRDNMSSFGSSLFGNLSNTKDIYFYDAYKENSPYMKYDGSCNVTFKLINTGHDTDSWTSGYKLIELGMVENATCYDTYITRPSTATVDGAYRYITSGLTAGYIENDTKKNDGKYDNIAQFIQSLTSCKASSQCNIQGSWIPSYKNDSCGVVTPICGATNNTCTAGTLVDADDTSTQYKWSCNGSGGGGNVSCSETMPTTPIEPKCGDINNICMQGNSTDQDDSATHYRWKCNGLNGGGNKSCSLPIPSSTPSPVCGATVNACSTGNSVDLDDTATDYFWKCTGTGNQNTVCSYPIGATNGSCGTTVDSCNPGQFVEVADSDTDYLWTCAGTGGGVPQSCALGKPVINISKIPKISLNKYGTCTIVWDIQNMPTATVCTLTGPSYSGVITDYTDEKSFPNLVVNTKVAITCTEGGLATPMVASVICRINPDIQED